MWLTSFPAGESSGGGREVPDPSEEPGTQQDRDSPPGLRDLLQERSDR